MAEVNRGLPEIATVCPRHLLGLTPTACLTRPAFSTTMTYTTLTKVSLLPSIEKW